MLKVLFGTRTVRQSCWTSGCWQEGDFLIPLPHPLLRCTTHPLFCVPCSFGTSVSYRLSWLLWVAAWNWSLTFLQEWLLLLSQVIFHMRCCLSVCRLVDYEQSLFFLGPSSKTPEIRKWPRAWLKARDGRGTTRERLAAKPEAAALVSLARVQLPLLNLKKKRDYSQSSRLVPSRLLFIIDHSLIAHNTPFLPPQI